ncbi:MAG: DUF1987 domain-containing protein [Flavobacteriales bacterium]
MNTMEILFIEGTEQTPKVDFNHTDGKLLIRGRSLPENAVEFYSPMFSWLDNYVEVAPQRTELSIDLDYLNSISQKMMVEILKSARKLVDLGKDVVVNWYYDEEDEKMLEEGKNLALENELEFNMFERPETE